jgi:anti-sigma regulatory factor (Ser/Thr protein kinase)
VTGSDATDPAHTSRRVILPVRGPQDLSWARTTVIGTATATGMDEDRAAKLALAVTEIATNALIHADGGAHLEIITNSSSITVEISDRGPGLPPDHLVELPPASHDRGRGLWLAEHLCDRVDVLPTADGTRIALSMDR